MDNTGKHIAILCSRLDLAGGIERAVVNTAGLFAENGHKVTLVILDDTKDSFYPIPSSVSILWQQLSFGITREGNVVTRKIKLLTDVLKLRKLLRQLKPDIVIASEYPFACASILSGARKRSRIYSWEHHHFYELKRNNFWERIFRNTYPKLHGIICLNEDEKKLFSSISPTEFVVPNFIERASRSSLENRTILTVARLTPVKGIVDLLEVAKEVLSVNPGWTWKLIGDGELKDDVKQFIEKEKLQDRLIIQQPQDHNIQFEYQNASLYVMISLNECFPMTLLEAQASGLPCIAFDCETGPRHIIIDGENGFLIEAENKIAMIRSVSSLISDLEKRKQMGEAAYNSVQRFSANEVYKKWSGLLNG